MRIRVIGSLGLIAQAVDEGRVDLDAAVQALNALPTRGRLHISADLIARAISSIRGR